MSCTRARSYLADTLDESKVVDARKERVGADDLAPWFRGRKQLIVAKGKKWATHEVKKLKADERAELVLGPSGNLRAPTLLVGDTILVGFNEEAYADTLG